MNTINTSSTNLVSKILSIAQSLPVKRPMFPMEAQKADELAKKIAETGKYDPQKVLKTVDWIVKNTWDSLLPEGQQITASLKSAMAFAPSYPSADIISHQLELLAYHCDPVDYPLPANPS